MQKILLLSVLLIFSSPVKSQDSTKAVLITLYKYTTNIEDLLLKMNGSIKANGYTEIEQQAEEIRASLDSIDVDMQYLSDEYYYSASPALDDYKTGVEDLKKIIAEKESRDKDKLISEAFTRLQQRQNELRKALKSAYGKALQETGTESKQQNEMVQEDTTQPLYPSVTNEDTSTVNRDSVSANEATMDAAATSDNLIVLNTIHETQTQIEGWIDSIHVAMKKNNFSKVGVYAKNISNASLKISDLILLIRTDKKESLLILATGLKNLTEALHELSHNGMKSHHEMHETIDKMEIKFSTLSTGISLVSR